MQNFQLPRGKIVKYTLPGFEVSYHISTSQGCMHSNEPYENVISKIAIKNSGWQICY